MNPTSSMAMPIGIRSMSSVIMATMPMTPTSSEVSIGQLLLRGLPDSLDALNEHDEREHRRAEGDGVAERIMRPAQHVADLADGGGGLHRGAPGNHGEQGRPGESDDRRQITQRRPV